MYVYTHTLYIDRSFYSFRNTLNRKEFNGYIKNFASDAQV